jgi:sugar/nucleoside kinase (ribokinase family)
MNIETSLSLSDPFCVDRHRDELKEFIEEYVDLVFCNFDEAKMFAQSETMADVSTFFQSFGKKIAMTASAEGAYYFHGETVAHQPAQKIEQVVDTTGAGDNFAAGFLDQYLSDKTIDEALAQGNARAGEVIQQLGPRIKRH